MSRSSYYGLLLVALVAPVHALQLGVPAAVRPAATISRASVHLQLAPAPLKQKTKQTTDGGGKGPGGGGGGAQLQIAKPKRKLEREDVPLFKVLLLGDAEYIEDNVRAAKNRCRVFVSSFLIFANPSDKLARSPHTLAQVCDVLRTVIPEIENSRQAQEKFKEAQNNGKALLSVVNKELGEHYVDCLAKHDPEMIVFADLEEE